ncbi:unnamed protein product [Adineta steineri]|uniref:Serine-threonine/tyrosine-protein kinase catalytic domain-containing protein n=1 Tax=Adineta steineri TaxID=433720 RepID=A0A815AIS2_9BILA|nr:unnamed protein product [Adineta steineri]CAF1258338.1 unnamed protein product [Adineta steineri]CAF1399947.1 unnamed protein product [Adineta steineri]
MGTKISRQHHRTALTRDNIPRIANQEIQNFNEIFSSTAVEVPLEEEKSHNHLATKKYRYDPNIQKEALNIRKSQSTGDLSSATLVFTDQQLLNNHKKQTHRNKASSSQNSSRVHSDSTTNFDHISSSKLKRKKIPYNSQLDFIDSKDLKYVREIGKGTFGTVHRALYKGTYDVALKTLNIQDENPNRSSIYDDDDEYMYQLNYFGRQIYEAMLYLEERHIIHQNLATRNCLIDEDDTLKVADVGVPYLTGIDSFVQMFGGITLWEIYSLGERPFGNMTNDALPIVLENPSEILSRYLPKPRHCGSDETYTHIILPCLTNSVTMRPCFRDLKQRILDILVNEI